MIHVEAIDHVVLTVADVQRTYACRPVCTLPSPPRPMRCLRMHPPSAFFDGPTLGAYLAAAVALGVRLAFLTRT